MSQEQHPLNAANDQDDLLDETTTRCRPQLHAMDEEEEKPDPPPPGG